jgi:ribose-phosphate pyrophosphokinase
MPVDNLYTAPLFAKYIKKKLNKKKLICVSPDVGGVARTRDLAKRIKADLAIIDKRRPAPGKSEVMNILGNVKGKTCIIVDDIIDSGGTIINAVNALIKNGANEVYVFISHAVLSGDAAKKIKNSKIKKLVVTDTIDNSKKINNNNKIEVLSVSSLMSEAIKRIANSNSVSDLFN